MGNLRKNKGDSLWVRYECEIPGVLFTGLVVLLVGLLTIVFAFPPHPLGLPANVEVWEDQQVGKQAEQQVEQRVYEIPEKPEHPASWDWRNVDGKDFTAPIKDQGDCGSCVAFAVTSTIESVYKVMNHSPDAEIDLSEAAIYFCAGSRLRSCDEGMTVEEAYNFLSSRGVVEEQCFPYTDYTQPCHLCSGQIANTFRIQGWFGTTDVDEAKYIISHYGPVTATMWVYTDFGWYMGGIYRHRWGFLEGGHAVTIVGYDDTGQYWIGQNSWGTEWGEGGYFRIDYGEAGIDNYFYVPQLNQP